MEFFSEKIMLIGGVVYLFYGSLGILGRVVYHIVYGEINIFFYI